MSVNNYIYINVKKLNKIYYKFIEIKLYVRLKLNSTK